MTAAEEVRPSPEVHAYAAEVRAALADVPAERSAELLDDLEDHLAEVALEGDGTLATKLGPPADYAAELRRSAGLAEPAVPPAARWHDGVSRRLERLRTSRPVTAVADFLPELRPAWWVLRAWAALLAVDAIFIGNTSFPVPTLGISPVVGLVLTGAAITWSVRRGLRARGNPGLGNARLAVVEGPLGPDGPAAVVTQVGRQADRGVGGGRHGVPLSHASAG